MREVLICFWEVFHNSVDFRHALKFSWNLFIVVSLWCGECLLKMWMTNKRLLNFNLNRVLFEKSRAYTNHKINRVLTPENTEEINFSQNSNQNVEFNKSERWKFAPIKESFSEKSKENRNRFFFSLTLLHIQEMNVHLFNVIKSISK